MLGAQEGVTVHAPGTRSAGQYTCVQWDKVSGTVQRDKVMISGTVQQDKVSGTTQGAMVH